MLEQIIKATRAFAQPSFPAGAAHAQVPTNPAERAAHFKAAAEVRAQETVALKMVLQAAVASKEVEFIHAGRTTIAYRVRRPGGIRAGSVVDIATSVCHPGDQYSHWRGSAYAARNLAQGKFITVKTPKQFGMYRTTRDFVLAIADTISLD